MCRKCYYEQKQGYIICEYCGTFLIRQEKFDFDSCRYKPLFGNIRSVVSGCARK